MAASRGPSSRLPPPAAAPSTSTSGAWRRSLQRSSRKRENPCRFVSRSTLPYMVDIGGGHTMDRVSMALAWGGLAALVYLVYLVIEPFLVPLGWAGVLAV